MREDISRRTFLGGSLGVGAAASSATALAAFLEACGGSKNDSGSTSTKKDIVIGAVLALTGSNAGFGVGTSRGIQTAVKLVNDAGGIKSLAGSTLVLKIYDTQSKPDVAGSQATKAIQDGCVALIGCNQSPSAVVASQIAEREKVPFVTPSDFDPSLTGRGFKYMFQTDPFVTDHVRDMLTFARDTGQKAGAPARKLGILCDNTNVGQSAQTAFEKQGAQLGFTIAVSDSYALSVTDFSTYIAKMKAAGAELLLGFQTPQPAVLVVKAMKEQHFEPLGFGGILGGQVNTDYIKSLGADADYTLCSSAWGSDLKIPGMEKVIKEFNAQWNEEMDDVRAAGFVGVAVVWDGLERAKSSDPKKLRDAIAVTNLDPGQRNFIDLEGCKFDETGYNSHAKVDIKQIKDKAWHSISPAKYASSFKPVWPKPKWA